MTAAIEGPEDTWKVVRDMMGATNPRDAAPGTIRGDLGIEFTENLIHGSDGPESAARELGLFFPGSVARSASRRSGAAAAWRRPLYLVRPARSARPPMPEGTPVPSNSIALGRDMAVDLGTANTLVYVRGHGIVLERAVGRRHQRPRRAARSRSGSRPSG